MSADQLRATEQLDRAQLPTEVLLMIAQYASLGAVVHLALVNRRLHQLLLVPSSSANTYSSTRRSYRPVTFVVEEQTNEASAVQGCVVRVGIERINCTGSGGRGVSSLLSVLRHVSELRLVFHRVGTVSYWVEHVVPSAAVSSLRHFTQLRSLEVSGVRYIAAASLAAALDSLPSLTNLELNAYPIMESDELTAALHRLCSTQLDHLTLSRRRLYYLVQHQPRSAMPHLRSLAVTPAESAR